mmetsp:Transcript_4224/g.7808  ORF Transcript_4224/g.7808 Transcript_4224/m.7808 type:complete len:116 (-) Transcript_4224:510-857(-)
MCIWSARASNPLVEDRLVHTEFAQLPGASNEIVHCWILARMPCLLMIASNESHCECALQVLERELDADGIALCTLHRDLKRLRCDLLLNLPQRLFWPEVARLPTESHCSRIAALR